MFDPKINQICLVAEYHNWKIPNFQANAMIARELLCGVTGCLCFGAVGSDHCSNTHPLFPSLYESARKAHPNRTTTQPIHRFASFTAFIFFAHSYRHNPPPHSEIWTIHVNKRNRRYFGRHWRPWYWLGNSLV